MKQCSFCKKEKEFASFNKKGLRKDGSQKYQTICKDCNSEYLKVHYVENKQYYLNKADKSNKVNKRTVLLYLKEYAKDGCIICGEKEFACIQFDHREPSQKLHNISSMIKKGYALDKVKEELKKCDVLCSNCHAKRTAKQFSWYKCLDDAP